MRKSEKLLKFQESKLYVWLALGIVAFMTFGIGQFVYSTIPNSLYRYEMHEFIDLELTEVESSPVISGELLLVNLDTARTDSLQEQLPSFVAASSKDEVTSVIWIDCDSVAIGSQGGMRVIANCLLDVVDVVERVKFPQIEIKGLERVDPNEQSPVVVYSSGGDFYDIRNEEAILNYVLSILRQ